MKDKLKKHFSVISVAVLAGLLLVSTIQYSQKRNQVIGLVEQINLLQELDKLDERIFELQVKTDNTKLSEEIYSQIEQQIDGDFSLVYLFGKSNCSFCIEQGLKLLQENLSLIDGDQLLLLSQFEQDRAVSSLVENYQLGDIDRVNITEGKIDLEIASLSRPSFFIVSKDKKLHHTFIIEKKTPFKTRKYLELISKKLKAANIRKTYYIRNVNPSENEVSMPSPKMRIKKQKKIE